MTPTEALHLVLRQAQECRHPDPVYPGEWECEDLVARLSMLGYTVARRDDAADGEELRELREALPKGWCVRVESMTPTPRRDHNCWVVVLYSRMDRLTGVGASIAEAARAAREALR